MTQPTPDPNSRPHQSANHAGGDINQVGGNNTVTNTSTFTFLIPMIALGSMVAFGLVFGRGIGTQVNPSQPAAPASASPNP